MNFAARTREPPATTFVPPPRLLQRTCACGGTPGPTGECAECRRKRRLGVQPKLRISQPGDRWEREADRVADAVVRTSSETESLAARLSPVESLPGTEFGVPARAPTVQRNASVDGAAFAPPIVHDVLKSGGRPLEPATRSFMESRFGYDFARVRVHTDARAAASAQAVQARAYTAGDDIVFDSGEYRPHTARGRRLIAHELAHVVQQRGSSMTLQRAFRASPVCVSLMNARGKSSPSMGIAVETLVKAAFMRQVGPLTPVRIPNASAAPFRTEGSPGRDSIIDPEIIDLVTGTLLGTGIPDLAYKNGTQMELAEVKPASWLWLVFGELQLARYVRKGNAPENSDLRAALGVRRFVRMPRNRFALRRPLFVQGKRVRVVHCEPGLILYKAIEPQQRRSQNRGQQRPRGQARSANLGIGISLGGMGGGAGNAGIGISIESNGVSIGTVGAGIVYNSDGVAVGTVGAGVSVESDSAAAGAVGAGLSAESSTAGAGVAGAGSVRASEIAGAGLAGAGSVRDAESTAVGTTSSGDEVGATEPSIGEPGPHEAETGEAATSRQHASDGTGGTAEIGSAYGLDVPGVPVEEVRAAVEEAARVDAMLQHASEAQLRLLRELAQRSRDDVYTVPSHEWVAILLYASAGLSDQDLAYLATLDWRPGRVTPEELRRRVHWATRQREASNPVDGEIREPMPRVDQSPQRERPRLDQPPRERPTPRSPEPDGRPSQPRIGPAAGGDAGRIRERSPEEFAAEVARLQARARAFDWANRPAGAIVFDDPHRDELNSSFPATLYANLGPGDGDEPGRFIAKVRGQRRCEGVRTIFVIESSGIVVSTTGQVSLGARLEGQAFELDLVCPTTDAAQATDNP